MAKRFFNKRVKSKKNKLISGLVIFLCIIGIIICILITRTFSSDNPKETIKIKVQDYVSVNQNTKLPEKYLFFKELEGIKEEAIKIDMSKVKLDTLGDYEITIIIDKKEYKSIVKVVDLIKPELKLKEIVIKENEKYNVESFIESCKDNSKSDCKISFYKDSLDQNSKPIDYSNYKKKGEYDIKIIATDVNGNETIQTTKLIIGNKTTTVKPTTCKYGTDEYNTSNVLTHSVSTNGCALSLDLYQNTTIRKAMDNIANNETEKIKMAVDDIKGLQNNIVINKNIDAILNKTGNGFVGYNLYVEVISGDKTVVSYYLKENGSRVYIENPYNIK